MTSDQFYKIILCAACFLGAEILIWGCYGLYLVLTGKV